MRMSVQTKGGSVDTVNLNPRHIRQLRDVPMIESVLAMDYHAMILTGRDLPENVNISGLSRTASRSRHATGAGTGALASDGSTAAIPNLSRYWGTSSGTSVWAATRMPSEDAATRSQELHHRGRRGPRFRWYSADVYLPLNMKLDPNHFCIVDFYLRPGVTRQAADAALEPLLQEFARDTPKRFPEQFHTHVEGLNAWVERTSAEPSICCWEGWPCYWNRLRECLDPAAGGGHGAAT